MEGREFADSEAFVQLFFYFRFSRVPSWIGPSFRGPLKENNQLLPALLCLLFILFGVSCRLHTLQNVQKKSSAPPSITHSHGTRAHLSPTLLTGCGCNQW
eukprot:EG_transcript_26751